MRPDDSGGAHSRSRQLPLAILLLAHLVYLAVIVWGGRFLGGDEIPYKAAGREWAESGRFEAPELAGYIPWRNRAEPQAPVRGFGPPLYTFGFGLFSAAFGFGPRVNAAYDALIIIALSLVTFLLTRQLQRHVPGASSQRGLRSVRADWLAAAAAAAVLPLARAGRPDALGATLALAGAAIGLHAGARAGAILAGVLFGLAGGTSIIAPILSAWPLLVWVRRKEWASAILLSLSCAASLTLVMLPMFILMPHGPEQFSTLAKSSALTTFADGLSHGLRYGRQNYVAACIGLLAAIASFVKWRRNAQAGAWLDVWAPPLAATAAIILVFPAKYYYVGMVVPALFAAAAASVEPVRRIGGRELAVIGASAILWVAAASRFFLMTAIHATLPPEQQLQPNVEVVRRTIPPGAGVLVWDYWPALASRYETYATDSQAPPWHRIDYAVLTANGSGTPGQRQRLLPGQEAAIQRDFVVIYDGLSRQASRFGPVRLNSAWGYGPVILRRVRPAAIGGGTDLSSPTR